MKILKVILILWCISFLSYLDNVVLSSIDCDIHNYPYRIIRGEITGDFIQQAFRRGKVYDITSQKRGAEILDKVVRFFEYTGAENVKRYLMELVADGSVKFVDLDFVIENLKGDDLIIKNNEIKDNLKKRAADDDIIYVSDVISQCERFLIDALGKKLNLDSRVLMQASKMFFHWNNAERFNSVIDRFSKSEQEVNMEILDSISRDGLISSRLEEMGLKGVVVGRGLEVLISLYRGYYAVFPVMAERPWVDPFNLQFQDTQEIQDRLNNTILCVTVKDESLDLERTTTFPDYKDFDSSTGEMINRPVNFDKYDSYEEIPFGDRDIAFRPLSFEYRVGEHGIPSEKINYFLVPEELYDVARQILPEDKIIKVGYVERKICFTLKDGDAAYTLSSDQSETFTVPDYEKAVLELLQRKDCKLFLHGVKLYSDKDVGAMVDYMQKLKDKEIKFMQQDSHLIGLFDKKAQDLLDLED